MNIRKTGLRQRYYRRTLQLGEMLQRELHKGWPILADMLGTYGLWIVFITVFLTAVFSIIKSQ